MKKIFLLLALLLAASAFSPGQTFMTITGSNTTGAGGLPLQSGTMIWQAVDNSGNPIGYQLGGGGQQITTPTVCGIANGAILSPCQIANTSLTNPANVCFSITIKDSNNNVITGGPNSGYQCVQPQTSNYWCTSSVCNFDQYIPNTPSQLLARLPPPQLLSLGGVYAATCPSNLVANGVLGTGYLSCVAGGSGGGSVFVNGTQISSPNFINTNNFSWTFTGSNVSGTITGVIPIANLAAGTPDGFKFIADNGVLQYAVNYGGSPVTSLVRGSGIGFSLTSGALTISTSSTPPTNTPSISHQFLTSYNSTTGAFGQAQPSVNDVSGAAPLASPTFTGSPAAPTATLSDSSTLLATTAFVKNQGYLTSAPVTSVAGKVGIVTLVEADIGSLVADLALKAPVASPALTGTPTAPTATSSDSSTTISTTAFVKAQGYAVGTNNGLHSIPFWGSGGSGAHDLTQSNGLWFDVSTLTLNVGAPGSQSGGVNFCATTGCVKLVPQASAALRTIVVPNASGTIAVSASGLLAIDANTGALTCANCASVANPLSQFAATSSAQLAAVISDEIGSGKSVFATALQGTDANLLTSGTISGGAGTPLCLDAQSGATTVSCNNAGGGTVSSITFTFPLTATTITSTGTVGISNATTGAVGVIQLAGDFGGTGALPTVLNGSHITNASIPNSGLVNASITINGTSVALGGTSSLVLQTVGVTNAMPNGLNFVVSTANTTGLLISPVNAATNQEKFEISGSLGLASIASIAANSIVMNGTGSGAVPTAVALATCAGTTNASMWDTTTHAWRCNPITGSVTVNGGSSITGPNFQNSTAVNGVAINFSNPSGVNVQAALSGTLANTGLANSSVTINSQSVALGASINLPFQVNGTNTNLNGINLISSSVNSAGLTVTASNPGTNQVKFEVTGAAFTGTAANLTAAALLPNGTTAFTQPTTDSSGKIATTLYVTQAISANGCGGTYCAQVPLVGGNPVGGIITANGTNGVTSAATLSDITAAAGYTPANDENVMHLVGNETVNGLKTFTNDITFNGNVNILGSANFTSTGPFLLQGIKQTGVPSITAGQDYGIYVSAAGTLSCLLSTGGNCLTGIPPGGSAGGDVTGTYPSSLIVSKVNGGSVSTNVALLGSNGSSQLVAATAHAFSSVVHCSDTAVVANTYVCATGLSFTLAKNDIIVLDSINQNNTGASTLSVNLGSNIPIKSYQGTTTLVAGDLHSGGSVALQFDGSNLQMLGPVANAPSGSGTVNSSSFALCPAFYLGTGTAVSCPNATTTGVTVASAFGTGLTVATVPSPVFSLSSVYTSAQTSAPIFQMTSQFPGTDVMAITGCSTNSSCVASIKWLFVDKTGVLNIQQALQMINGAPVQANAGNNTLNLWGGLDGNVAQGSVFLRGGKVTGAGNVTAGITNISPGYLDGSSVGGTAQEGTIVFNGGVYQHSGTTTPGNLAIFVGNNLIGDSTSVALNQNLIGVTSSVSNNSYFVQTEGTAGPGNTTLPNSSPQVNLDTTYTFVAGDFVCPSLTTPGKSTIVAASTGHGCFGSQVGFATAAGTAVNTVTTLLSITHNSAVTRVASGTFTLGTSLIASGACATTVTVAATGALTTDVVTVAPNASLKAVTGYIPSTSGTLTIYPPYATANNVNIDVCNMTGAGIMPGAVTLNWIDQR